MTDKYTEPQFIKACKNAFDKSVAGIDAKTRADLRQLRQNAIAKYTCKNYSWIYFPAGVTVITCLAVIIYVFTITSDTYNISPDDIDILSRSESLEFYENLEFYEWLEEYDLST
jgi:hypothetical protein